MHLGRGKTFIGIAGVILAVELMGVPTWLAFILLVVSLVFLAWGIAPIQTRKIMDRVPIPNFPAVLDRLDRVIEAPHKADDRLRKVKRELGKFWAEAQIMRENAEAKHLETHVLQEPEKTIRLEEWDVPDCREWQRRTSDYIEQEVGMRKAIEFRQRYPSSDQYDWQDPGFIAGFLGDKQQDFNEIIDSIREEDLS